MSFLPRIDVDDDHWSKFPIEGTVETTFAATPDQIREAIRDVCHRSFFLLRESEDGFLYPFSPANAAGLETDLVVRLIPKNDRETIMRTVYSVMFVHQTNRRTLPWLREWEQEHVPTPFFFQRPLQSFWLRRNPQGATTAFLHKVEKRLRAITESQ